MIKDKLEWSAQLSFFQFLPVYIFEVKLQLIVQFIRKIIKAVAVIIGFPRYNATP